MFIDTIEPAKRSRRTDPSTSKEAAAALKPALIVQRYTSITLALREHGPMGCSEIALRTGLDVQEVTRRAVEISGLTIMLTGKRVKSAKGRAEREWCAMGVA